MTPLSQVRKALIVLSLLTLPFILTAGPPRITDKTTTLEPGAVQLSGYLDKYIRLSIDNWNKGPLPYGEFVGFFRQHSAPQFALGEMWGKAVRSGCMFYRYTRDPELKEIIAATVTDMLSTQCDNGSFSCTAPEMQPGSENGDLWERKYVMLGLLEYYAWVDNDPEVLLALRKHADCIIDQVGHEPKKEITDLGWSFTAAGYEECHIESATLLEPFMRLYNLTDDKRYLDFARYIVESGGTKHFDLIQQACDNIDPCRMSGHYPKAYEMLSFFEGVAEYYRTTGDERCRKALVNMYDNVCRREITIIGNAGADRPYHPDVAGEAWGNTAFEQTNPDITRMMETCVGITWLKFCSQIARLTGDSKPFDDIERYVYNGLIGAMKPSGDGFSYVNLLNGNKVVNYGWGWNFDSHYVTCCNLNGPMGLAYLPYVAIMEDRKGPVVNLYNAATVDTSTPGGRKLRLTIDSEFPKTGEVEIRVIPQKKEKFDLKLRIPSWSKNTVLKINGKEIPVEPGDYAVLTRRWQPGDIIELSLDMTCRLIDAPLGSNRAGDKFQALLRGPIVLTRDQNTDPDYDKPVKIKATEEGIVDIRPVHPTLSTTCMEFIVPTDRGDIRMVDYASADGWKGSKICTWLPLP